MAVTVVCVNIPAHAEGKTPAAAASAVHARGGYPSDLPRYVDKQLEHGDVEVDSSDEASTEDTIAPQTPATALPRPRSEPPFFLTAILPALMIAGLVAALIVGVVGLFRRRREAVAAVSERADARSIESVTEQATPELAALIAAGHYDLAVYALFIRACQHLGALPAVRDRSRTARELLAGVSSADPRRKPFQTVVELAERVRFAGLRASLDDVERAREAVDQLQSLEARP